MGTAVESVASAGTSYRYAEHVNPQWVRLLDLLEMNVRYERCVGAELFTSEGRRILDFLSGYCVHNVGHNHPHVVHGAVRGRSDRAVGERAAAKQPDVTGRGGCDGVVKAHCRVGHQP